MTTTRPVPPFRQVSLRFDQKAGRFVPCRPGAATLMVWLDATARAVQRDRDDDEWRYTANPEAGLDREALLALFDEDPGLRGL